MNGDRYDVIICGAGIGGLTAALALGRAGWRVLLLDKQANPGRVHKGEVLQPRSARIFERLGLLAPLREAGALRGDRLVCRTGDGRMIVSLDYRRLPDPYNRLVVHYYPDIQAAVARALPPNVEVRRGVRATGLHHDSDGRVRGVTVGGAELSAGLVVGADGIASTLRDRAGLDVAKFRYPHRLLAFDLAGRPDPGSGAADAGDQAATDVCAYLGARGLRLLYPMPGDRRRLYVQTTEDEYRAVGRAGLPDWAEGVVRDAPALRPLRDALLAGVASVQPMQAWRYLAPTWWRPGFALLGDAAHGVHPMAAQGMNAAIADADALAEALTGCAPGDAAGVDAALANYERAGLDRMAYVSRLSHRLARLFTDTSWRARVVGQWMISRNQENRRLQYILTYNMSGLGVRRFTARDRLYQVGLRRDPDANRLPDLPVPA